MEWEAKKTGIQSRHSEILREIDQKYGEGAALKPIQIKETHQSILKTPIPGNYRTWVLETAKALSIDHIRVGKRGYS